MSERFQERYRIPSTRLQNWDYGWNAIYFITLCTAGHEHRFGKITDGVMYLSETGLLAKKYWCEIPQHFKFIDLDAFVVMPNHIHGILLINKWDDERYNADWNLAPPCRDAIYRVSIPTDTNDNAKNAIYRVSIPTDTNDNAENAIYRVSIPTDTNDNAGNAIYRVSVTTSMNDNIEDAINRVTKPMGADDVVRDAINRVSTGGGVTGTHNPMLHENLSTVIRWYKGRVTYESRRINHPFDWQPRFYDHIIRTDESFDRIRQYIDTNIANWGKDKYFCS